MTEVDEAILEFLHELDADGRPVALKPGAVHFNLVEEYGMIDKSLSTFSREMSKLDEKELLEKAEDRKGSPYRITDLGRRYLEGELTEEEVEDLRDDEE